MHKNEPSKETRPHATQIIKHKPTDSVSCKTRLGETNIPDPIKRIFIILRIIIIQFLLPIIPPTIKQTPENKPRCLFSVTASVGSATFNESSLTIDPVVKRRR